MSLSRSAGKAKLAGRRPTPAVCSCVGWLLRAWRGLAGGVEPGPGCCKSAKNRPALSLVCGGVAVNINGLGGPFPRLLQEHPWGFLWDGLLSESIAAWCRGPGWILTK